MTVPGVERGIVPKYVHDRVCFEIPRNPRTECLNSITVLKSCSSGKKEHSRLGSVSLGRLMIRQCNCNYALQRHDRESTTRTRNAELTSTSTVSSYSAA